MVSFTLLYLVLVFLHTLIPFTGLFLNPISFVFFYLLIYLTMISFLLLYLVLVFLPTLLPFNGLFLTPIHLVLLSYLLLYLWSLLTLLPCASLFLTPLCWSFYLLPYLTLDSFTPLYLVLVFLPTPIPYTGLFQTPLPLMVSLPTPIPYTCLFHTPQPGAGLFT